MSTNPHRASDTPEMTELLDDYRDAIQDFEHLDEGISEELFQQWVQTRNAARMAIESAFSKLREELTHEERAASKLLDERDSAEEALSQAYFLITGRSPEWSNLFGYREALDEIDGAQEMLRTEISRLSLENKRLRQRRPTEIDEVEIMQGLLDGGSGEATQTGQYNAPAPRTSDTLSPPSLTPEEAAAILEMLSTAGCRPSENPALFDKLFRLRSLGTPE